MREEASTTESEPHRDTCPREDRRATKHQLLFSFEAWMVYSVLPEFGGCQTSGFFDGTKSCSPNCGTGNSLGASGTRWRGRFGPVSFSSSILRCNVMKAWMSASGRGGQPGMCTSTGM